MYCISWAFFAVTVEIKEAGVSRHWNDDQQNSFLVYVPAEHERGEGTHGNAANEVSPACCMEPCVYQWRLQQYNTHTKRPYPTQNSHFNIIKSHKNNLSPSLRFNGHFPGEPGLAGV